MPERIQRKRVIGWRMPPGAIYVGRPTKWGNPFVIGAALSFPWNGKFGPIVRDRAHAIELFRSYARVTSGYELLVRRDLARKDLCCWCPLDQPCHADVLLEVANA